jgi:acyl carrier protein
MRDNIEAELKSLIVKLVPNFCFQTDIKAQLDSIQTVGLLLDIEKRFSISFSAMELVIRQGLNFDKMVDIIESKINSNNK